MVRRASPGQTVRNPHRDPLYDIYGDPREIVGEAAQRVAPESPHLRDVFGVTRGDLDAINEGGRRRGAAPPEEVISLAPTPRGSEAAHNIMTPRNEQRILDILGEASKVPGLRVGMANWYVSDPIYQRLERMYGPDEAARRFTALNAFVGMSSAGTPVHHEIPRGLAAHHLHTQGRFRDFERYGGESGLLETMTGLQGIPGHPYHSTSQVSPMRGFIEAGDLSRMRKPKVRSYIHASSVPMESAPGMSDMPPGLQATGPGALWLRHQTSTPVGDSHFSRILGLSDTREGPYGIESSWSRPEAQTLIPWFNPIARHAGYEPVPAQAMLWGAGSHRTGVETRIGAPKIEILADHIARRAAQEGVPLEVMRDDILSGRSYDVGGKVGEAQALRENAMLKSVTGGGALGAALAILTRGRFRQRPVSSSIGVGLLGGGANQVASGMQDMRDLKAIREEDDELARRYGGKT